MKKAKYFLLTALAGVFMCLCFVLTACSSKIEGTYKFKSMSYTQGGVTVELKAGETFMGAITLSEDFMTLTLNEDGSVSATMNAGEIETSTGTWTKKEDGKIEITINGDAQICSCDGKTLVISMDGSTVTLAK